MKRKLSKAGGKRYLSHLRWRLLYRQLLSLLAAEDNVAFGTDTGNGGKCFAFVV